MSNIQAKQGRGLETTRGAEAPPDLMELAPLVIANQSPARATPRVLDCPLSGSRLTGYLHTMTLAEKIFDEVRALPETQAREVLDFVGFLKSKRHTDRLLERQAALAELARY